MYIIKILLQGPQNIFGGPQFGHIGSLISSVLNSTMLTTHVCQGKAETTKAPCRYEFPTMLEYFLLVYLNWDLNRHSIKWCGTHTVIKNDNFYCFCSVKIEVWMKKVQAGKEEKNLFNMITLSVKFGLTEVDDNK